MVAAGLDTGRELKVSAEQIIADAEDAGNTAYQSSNDPRDRAAGIADHMTAQFNSVLNDVLPGAYAPEFAYVHSDFMDRAERISKRFKEALTIAAERDEANKNNPELKDEHTKKVLLATLTKYERLFSEYSHDSAREVIKRTLRGYHNHLDSARGVLDNQNLQNKKLFPNGVGTTRRSAFSHEKPLDQVENVLEDIRKRAGKGLDSALSAMSPDVNPQHQEKLLKTVDRYLRHIQTKLRNGAVVNASGVRVVNGGDIFGRIFIANEKFQHRLSELEEGFIVSDGDKCRNEIDKARAVFIRSIAQASEALEVQDKELVKANKKATNAIGNLMQREELDYSLQEETLSVLATGNVNPKANSRVERDVMTATLRHGKSSMKLAFDRPAGMSDRDWNDKLSQIGDVLAKIDAGKLYKDLEGGISQLEVNDPDFHELLKLSGGKIVQLANLKLTSTSGEKGDLFNIDCISYKPQNEVSFFNVIFDNVDLSGARLSNRDTADGAGETHFSGHFQVTNCLTVGTYGDVVVDPASAGTATFILSKNTMNEASWNADLRGISCSTRSLPKFWKKVSNRRIQINENNAFEAKRLPTDIDGVTTADGKSLILKNKGLVVDLYKGTIHKGIVKGPNGTVGGVFGKFTDDMDNLSSDAPIPQGLSADEVQSIMRRNDIISGEKLNLGTSSNTDDYYTTNFDTGDPEVALLFKKDKESGTINLVYGKRAPLHQRSASELEEDKLEKLKKITSELARQHKGLSPTEAIGILSKLGGPDIEKYFKKKDKSNTGRVI